MSTNLLWMSGFLGKWEPISSYIEREAKWPAERWGDTSHIMPRIEAFEVPAWLDFGIIIHHPYG